MVKKSYRVGIDIGGTKILAGIVNSKNKVVASQKARTVTEEGERYFLNTVTELVKRACEDASISLAEIEAIGIGCPGVIRAQDDTVVLAPNMPFLNNYPLGKRLAKEFGGVPVMVENDVNMGLYGEYCFGAAAGYKYVTGFFLGTGIGGALILDGKIYRGANGAAGEFGHIFLDPLGPECGCGNRGCLEAMVGRLAVSAEAAVTASRGHSKNLVEKTGTDIRDIKSGAMAKAIAAGDKPVRDLIRFKSELLGIAMANVVNILDPELIILGGGMVEAMGALIVPQAEKSMREHALPALGAKVRVAQAKLGDMAAVLGAAKMSADRR
jgi:glucokinase